MGLRLIFVRMVRYLIAALGMIFNIFKRDNNEIIILMYHRVNDDIKKELAVKKENFIWHMDYLKRKKYNVISMDEAYFRIRTNSINGRYLVLTFDDGYEDFYYNAFPILKEYNFPSMLYIVPGYIETEKVFWWDRELGESRLMDWPMLIELSKSGIVDFGSHTLNHIDLNKVKGYDLISEIRDSKKMIEDKTGCKVIHFSYPRGIYDRESADVIKRFYATGVLIYNGAEINKKIKDMDLFKLKRIPVQYSDGKYLFAARIKGWIKPEDMVRKFIYRIRGL